MSSELSGWQLFGRQQVLFRHLEQEQKEFVARAMFVMDFKNGDTIISQGDDGDNFYLAESGKVVCTKYLNTGDKEPTFLKEY